MKIVFAGPSIFQVDLSPYAFEIRGPARQGSILEAVHEGFAVIGLVDGWFGGSGSVWHKEILYGLQAGVQIFGSSSMGALRAAECVSFGMVPVGKIASAYLSGALDDDAAVAITSGPKELGYQPFVEPLVDAQHTIASLLKMGRLSPQEANALEQAASDIFFEDRTIDEMVRRAFGCSAQGSLIREIYEENRVSQKRDDAELLLERVSEANPVRVTPPRWKMQNSSFWRSQMMTATAAHLPAEDALSASSLQNGT